MLTVEDGLTILGQSSSKINSCDSACCNGEHKRELAYPFSCKRKKKAFDPVDYNVVALGGLSAHLQLQDILVYL